MNKWQLYLLLRKQDKLKDERNPMFDKNRFMKFLGVFMWLYYAALLIFLGVALSMGLKGEYNDVAAFHVLDGGLLYMLRLHRLCRECRRWSLCSRPHRSPATW